MSPDIERLLMGSRIRIKGKSPFFSVLIGHLPVVQVPDDSEIQTAATDGRFMYVNRPFWLSLTPDERDFVYVHETLHAALGHCWRLHGRIPAKWNIACDYVVNLICDEADFVSPKGAPFDYKFIGMTVEEVYALIPDHFVCWWCMSGDIKQAGGSAQQSASTWRSATAAAKAAERMYGSGTDGKLLDFHEEKAVVDWRSVLWKMADSNQDFDSWDRRMIHSEMYVEDLVRRSDAAGLNALFIDTSGSTFHVLGKFVGEVKQIAEITGQEFPLYFDDCELIGPLPLSEIDRPRGGGGTSFVPAFEEVERKGYGKVVYLTDLDGKFPDKTSAETLWVVPPGVTKKPPFGRVVKIV
jgi:predicted metal-dependent peptidase